LIQKLLLLFSGSESREGKGPIEIHIHNEMGGREFQRVIKK